MNYAPPTRDMRFALHEVLDVVSALDAVGIDIDHETIDGVVEGASELCTRALTPLNMTGDQEGCQLLADTVTTPTGFKKTYDHYVAGGWPAVTCDEEHGGGGLPSVVGMVLREILASSNPAWAMYPSLTLGAYRCLNANASEELKDRYLPKLASGEWTGTMCLTEPHCGTDLGLLTTRAEPADDGSFHITGTKTFISAGDHDLADNIVHLVLARRPGAPAGTRGLSLFVVPKHLVNEQGEPGARNGVTCDGVEHKMGVRGNATCSLRFEDAVGHLVGVPERGLQAMFVMMNAARLSTGVQALGLIESAQQRSLSYARERMQSRAPKPLHVDGQPADPIINQPDVRRMVLTQMAWAGGLRLFLYWLAIQADCSENARDPQTRDRAEQLLALLTPVAKAFASDRAVESANLAIQVHGGAGYIVEQGIEQVLRDARILPIYEGANGVQAHDLLARKIISDDGRRLGLFLEETSDFLRRIEATDGLAWLSNPLSTLSEQIDELSTDLARSAESDPLRVGASAVDFLNLLGYYVCGYFWARAAEAVVRMGDNATEFHRQQVAIAKFYFDKLLPDTTALLVRARSDTATLMDEAAVTTRLG